MSSRAIKLTFGVMLMIGMASFAVAQDNGPQQPSAREQLQHMHGPRSIDQELAHLTKDLELTPKQQQQVRPLLQDTMTRFRRRSTRIRTPRGRSLRLRFMLSATKRTARFMPAD